MVHFHRDRRARQRRAHPRRARGLVQAGPGKRLAVGVDHGRDERCVGAVATAQHHRGLVVVQPHEGAGRVRADGARERLRHIVAEAPALVGDRAHRIARAAPGARLARRDHCGVAVRRREHQRQAPLDRQALERARARRRVVVVRHHVQPELVPDAELVQQRRARHGVVRDGLLLLGRERLALQCQVVLQRGHADVHRDRGAHQRVALGRGQAQLAREQVAQRGAYQRVRGAVAHDRRGRELEHQVQRRVGVVADDVLQPQVALAHLEREVAHLPRVREQHRERRLQVQPVAEQVLVLVVGGRGGGGGHQRDCSTSSLPRRVIS